MMRITKLMSMLLLSAALIAGVTSCSHRTTLTDGSYKAESQGFGGTVSVEMSIAKDKITGLTITGKDETPGIGQAAIPKLQEAVLKQQSIDVDAIAGATYTSKAVKAALTEIMDEAKGLKTVKPESISMADGSYKASVWSFSPNFPLEVEVAVKDNRFESITVTGGNDTGPILKSAVDLLIPRMIENQSIAVDSVTGATASSTGIKSAVADCLLQAVQAAGGKESDMALLQKKPAAKSDKVSLETEVLVVGMGGSGIATAVRAAEEIYAARGNDASAVKVLGIEKAGKYGGTSAVTSSPMSINPPSFVAKAGGKDFVDVDVLKKAWVEYTEGDAKEWAIDVMMNESGKASDWLMERGFDFGAPMQGLAQPYLAVVAYGGRFGTSKSEVATYFDSIMKHYDEIGGEYILETSATGLITDSDGRVTGITAEGDDGTAYEIKADVIVLATGGFAGSSEMTEKYLSTEYYPLTGAPYNIYGMRQNDGAMLEAAIEKGAATFNMGTPPVSHIGGAAATMHEFETKVLPGTMDMWTGREMTQSLNDIPMMMAVSPDSLAVNAAGVRFADETALGGYGNWQAGPRFYTIWSAERINEIKTKGLHFATNGLFINQGGWPIDTPVNNIEDVLAKAQKNGIVVKADSLAGLASALKMDPAVLTKTVDNYNSYCDTKENPADGVVKSSVIYDLSGNVIPTEYSTFRKVEGDGPYYAVIGSPWIYSTAGGLDINKDFQVLDKSGKAIEGLYAVGTDSIGVLLTEKKEYVGYGGAAQGWAFTSGYLTGAIAADKVLNK